MNRVLFLVAVLLAAGAGFLIGRTDLLGGRARRSDAVTERGPNRRVVSLPAQEVMELRERADQSETLRAEIERLNAEVSRLERELEPKPGERRPDGTIVGGARWSQDFIQMATGFLNSMLAMFLSEAELTPEQERRVREEMDLRIGQAMALAADFINGEIDADSVYDTMASYYADAMRVVGSLLSEEQVKVYGRFESTVKDIIHQQVVHQELAVLKKDLGLDAEQAKKVLAIVDQRYRRVQEKIPAPLPNVLFKPIRRGRDRAIYDETAQAIRALLRPEQIPALDLFERSAPSAPFSFRKMLVPKTAPAPR